MGQVKATHRVKLALSLEQDDGPGTYGGQTWAELVESETTISLPIPKPDEVQYLVGSLVRGLVDIADAKGIPLTGERPEAEVRSERVLARITDAQSRAAIDGLTEAGYAAVLEGIRMILAGEADATSTAIDELGLEGDGEPVAELDPVEA